MEEYAAEWLFGILVVASIAGLVLALVRKKTLPAILGLLCAFPVCVYLLGYPGLLFLPLVLPVLLYLGSKEVSDRQAGKALLYFMPFLLLTVAVILFGFIVGAW